MHLLPESGNLGLGTWPSRRARIEPDRVALSQGDRQVTWRQLADRTARLASALAGLGVGKGDRVAYLGPNDLATFHTLFASGQIGAVFVPLNIRLAPSELRYMLTDSGARVLVLDSAVPFTADDLPEDSDVSVVMVEDLDRFLLQHEPLKRPAELSLEDPALFLYTSGTTGRPKAAVLTHAAITWNTVNQLAHIDFVSTDRALCIAPLFHAVGFGQITLPVLFKGGQVEIVPKFDAGVVLELVEQKRITGFSAVPTILQLLVEHPRWAETDLSSLRYINFGGSPAIARVIKAWQERGVVLQQGYGMTEAAPGVLMATAAGSLDNPASAGVPHFFTDIAHLDDAGHAVAVGDVPRELLIRGPHLFSGYWQRAEESAAELVDTAWFRTGDVLSFKEDGWGYVVDRIKDVIISGAENIYPAEVEAVLLEAAGVRSAAVIAVPDDRWGEVGEAFVESFPGAELDADDVLAFARTRLARFKVPVRLHIVPELPRNAAGKVLRQTLREQVGTVNDPGTDVSIPKGSS